MKHYFSLLHEKLKTVNAKNWLMNTKTTTLNDMETVKIQTISQN